MAYVMIIDDDEDFAGAAAMVFEHAGHEVAIHLDTQSALESMKQRQPDLAVLDVMFPEDSCAGFELARTMRHYGESLKDIPILMLTAVNARFPLGFSKRDIDDQWLPVSDFLEKPVDLDVLESRAEAMLQQRASGGSSQ